MSHTMPALATTLESVINAIHRFAFEVSKSPDLAGRLSYARAWYAVQTHDGGWVFGPSKFIGYENLDAPKYLAWSDQLHGRKTEDRLEPWFAPVDASSPIYAELNRELSEFLSKFGKAPSKSTRIKVLRQVPDMGDQASTAILDLLVAVAKTLPPAQLKSLRKQLKRISPGQRD